MDYSDTYDELNITLGDNDDVTFTPEEKARALKKAWNDPYVVKVVWDSTLTEADLTDIRLTNLLVKDGLS